MNAPDRKAALQGMGDSRLRKEDARFIQGKGNYVDDIKLPGMLHMDIVRSPLAHARIKKINKEKALAIPGVIAVLTADDLKPLKLHWMPTLAGDVAAVLADEKVHFQMQEVAVVIAEDRYIAADGLREVRIIDTFCAEWTEVLHHVAAAGEVFVHRFLERNRSVV